MIIWSGNGYLVAVIAFGISLFMELATEGITGNDQFYQESCWAFPLAMLLAAGVVFALAQGPESKTGDTFFFVPMKWWGPLLCAIALIAFGYQAVASPPAS